MSTSINVRLSDELEKELKNTVEQLKFKIPKGAEVNNSTIVRGALEEFIKKINAENNGIFNFPMPLGKLNNDELKKIIDTLELINKNLNDSSDGIECLKVFLELVRLKVKGMYIERM